MAKKYTTIKDIAKALGISVATVSRAMRDAYDVSPETRRQVLEAASIMKYRPNFNATGLVKSSTHKIGVIIPAITNYYFSTVITGIQEFALEKRYNIILHLTNDSAEWETKIVRELSLTSIDGILACISSETDDLGHFQELIDDGLPMVFFDRAASSILTSKVVQDDYQGARIATEHLIKCGYKKIAHITGPSGLGLTQNRLRGYHDTLEKHNLTSFGIIHSGFSRADGEKDLDQLFSTNEELPDAIFAVNDRKAIGAMLELRKRGVIVGKDIGIIGFTNDPISEIISPTLTTIAEPAYEIGKKSCELLIRHIQKSSFPIQELILPTELIVRESTMRL
ncbi:LacI family DNA-binding transcriptional regulator [Dyadobacter pollutisoli]|uniref:LacI family DNA-binding transcriptional regulator n=1 Tax=Dyadobacter pollutisoli TaxID=2910158 RepID=A0A9E8N5X1_9BACT|nr:LacI family DNA-binding transcriptional regulator [Dyadobacter pollutisoli]WAC10420.1 LacI family DNA-binding transcriptional regulator [Dyadobacter pollutisoli]